MSRLALIGLIAASRIATAGNAADLAEVDAEALASPFDPWVGGSLHYEHRDGSAFGWTLRGGATAGIAPFDDDNNFVRLFAVAGVREHWVHWYFEAALGWEAVRQPRQLDGYSRPVGVTWTHAPDFQLELGRQIGSVNVGMFTALLGFGVRVGVRFGD